MVRQLAVVVAEDSLVGLPAEGNPVVVPAGRILEAALGTQLVVEEELGCQMMQPALDRPVVLADQTW